MTARSKKNLDGRGGFVLPIVILLIVMVGSVTAIMLQRHVARAKTVERQLRAYQEHHGARSLQAVVEAWLKSPGAQPDEIVSMLEPDGLAFSVNPGDGTTIKVYLFPGQDTMLTRLGGLRPDDRAAGELAIQILHGLIRNQAEYERRTRAAGPAAVDVNSASPEVVMAIVQGILSDSFGARQYELALLDAAAQSGGVTLQTMSTIATETGIDAEQRSTLSRFLTVSPDLWRFRIDMYGSPMFGSRLLSRYRGLLLLGAGASTGGSSFEQPPPFLSWESVNPDDPVAVE